MSSMYFGGKLITSNTTINSNTGTNKNGEEGYPDPDEEAWMDGSQAQDSSMSGYDDDDEELDGSDLQSRAAKETRKTLASKENKAVICLRYFVLFVLMSTAVAVSLATFFYSRSVEHDSFQAEFASVAVVTLRSFVEAVEHKLSSLDAMATGITSHAIRTGETFPNVTIPDFEVKGATLRTQTDSIYMFWMPLVTDQDRLGYEAYTQMMQAQIFGSFISEEGFRMYQDAYFNVSIPTPPPEPEPQPQPEPTQEEPEVTQEQPLETQEETEVTLDEQGNQRRNLHVAPPDIHPLLHDTIWGLNPPFTDEAWPEPYGTGPYLPAWQLSPSIPLPSVNNFNMLDYADLAPMMRQSLDTGRAVLSYLQTNHSGAATEDLIRIFLSLNQYRHQNVDYNADPMTQVSYPVFDGFNPITRNVSGILLTTIFWRLLFQDILPENVQGVICVLGNTLGEQVTYRIDGKEVSYVGPGDLHDNKYNHMVVTRDISEYITQRAGVNSASYTFVELDVGYTSYSIHVYPSQDMENSYITKDPILYAIVVAFIFVFTSAVFITYDRCVEKRQKLVMETAVRSTSIVTSLFPQAVHDRLFGKIEEPSESVADAKGDTWKNMDDPNGVSGNMHLRTLQHQDNDDNDNNNNTDPAQAPLPSIQEMMEEQQNDLRNPESSPGFTLDKAGKIPLEKKKKKKGKAIADKFQSTTVFFADLAGFTQWSSTREPEHVFELLEALYGAFDRIALRRTVFKVETIGDCYMAVTGVPNPQPDHAIRMIKFARDCMMKMDRILEKLVPSLGEDTLNLKMRVGCHSGPVTAGVLRGDKGRFQLFGDTVNTASRMESNGVKGRIHVSEACADLLPTKWLTRREDKVVAKGKGEMQTYWVDASEGARSEFSALSALSSLSAVEENKPLMIGSKNIEKEQYEELLGSKHLNVDLEDLDFSISDIGDIERSQSMLSDISEGGDLEAQDSTQKGTITSNSLLGDLSLSESSLSEADLFMNEPVKKRSNAGKAARETTATRNLAIGMQEEPFRNEPGQTKSKSSTFITIGSMLVDAMNLKNEIEV
ncbi:Receptor-type guanylate cyclase gcy [Seminavis robusta]|uniref:Receptor-type guanylate cyclase gcy n=1 Tax=Seminavis robusta TaxID=568900 RepID=A0A9N8EIG8_9STRA|nr:Receptor-type guanylate cyclase gcy [Seminavis robusta]|eukprot:Sro1052_g235810.1 Receptor-type guanylate cyclase gcy (1052) ;mRNA; f:14612-19405